MVEAEVTKQVGLVEAFTFVQKVRLAQYFEMIDRECLGGRNTAADLERQVRAATITAALATSRPGRQLHVVRCARSSNGCREPATPKHTRLMTEGIDDRDAERSVWVAPPS